MKAYIESFTSHVRDRVFSPLSFAFIVSWLVWNYKFILVFFSDMKPYVKFSYISGQVYPDVLSAFLIGFAVPLATSLVYVGLYPFVTYGVMIVTNWHSNRIERLRITNEGEAIMSVESAKAFRREQSDRIKNIENELDESIEHVRRLKGEVKKSDEKIVELMQDKSDAGMLAQEEIKSLSAELQARGAENIAINSALSETRSQLERLSAIHDAMIASSSGLKVRLESSASEIQQLRAKIVALTNELESEVGRLKKYEDEIIELKNLVKLNKLKEDSPRPLQSIDLAALQAKLDALAPQAADKNVISEPVIHNLKPGVDSDVGALGKNKPLRGTERFSEVAVPKRSGNATNKITNKVLDNTLDQLMDYEFHKSPKDP